MLKGAVVGREAELASIDAFLAGHRGGLLITGEAGIGKTVLWGAAAERARVRGWRLLSCAPGEAEAQLSFAALGDLLTDPLGALAQRIPAPQRRPLEVALLLRPAEGAPPDRRAVALATTAVLRLLAEQDPVLVAVDDCQWLDASSMHALAFALRRLSTDQVRVLLTRRTGTAATDAALLADRDPVHIDLCPLSFGAVQRLLTDALASPVNHSTARRLHESAHGNPLHALELARVLDRTVPWTPLTFVPPADLAELVRSRLARLPAATREVLLVASAMSYPTIELLEAAGLPHVDEEIDRAVDAGLLLVDRTRLRFAHPLFASGCYRSATPARRRRAHARLAEIVADPERRARHLALARTEADESVAGDLDAGARHAHARGAPHAAAELAELARTLTPADDAVASERRAREAARYLLEAGESARARQMLEDVLAQQHPGPERARTLIALSAVLFDQDGVAAMRAAARQAIEEAAGDPQVAAEAHLALVERGELPAREALDHLARAREILDAQHGVDPQLHAAAMRDEAISRWQLGEGMPRELMARASELEQQSPWPPAVAWRARTCLGECIKYLDCFDEADDILRESERSAESAGDAGSVADIAGHRAELALWLGHWDVADEQAERAVESALVSEQRGRLALAVYFRCLVRAHRGLVDAARADARTALQEAARADDPWDVHLVRSALGFLEISLGDAARAAQQLAQVDALASTADLVQPRQWRYLGDHVEALIGCGDLAAAHDRCAALHRWAAEMGTLSARAAADRAGGLLHDATGEPEAALAALQAALAAFEQLPLPFERGRTLLALGVVQRRARRRRAARDSLSRALDAFHTLGAPLWAERASSELSRISGRTAAAADLTATEQRVAELVAQGQSNKQVAAALVITTRTVEAHLTRIYAKLGVRSRVELARRFG